MLRPLRGLKVLDLSRILAGPHAAQTLGDLGASVTKIEAPWGDDTKSWGPPFQKGFDGKDVASYYLCANRNKTIVHANIKEDREYIHSLMENADVVLENFKPGTLEKYLGPMPSNLIVCSITGYGQDGPRRDEPAFDLTMQARSGIMSITGEPNGPPSKVGVAWIDVMTGMNAVSSILAALYQRNQTGEGARIDISLWDTALASLVNQGHNALAGQTPSRMGSAHPNLVPYRVFKAKDGWFAIGVGTQRQWLALKEALQLHDAPEEWGDNSVRVAQRDLVEALVQDAVSQHSREDLEALLSAVIPCAPVNTVREALEEEQSVARGVVGQYEGVDVLASPLRFMTSPTALTEGSTG